MKTLQLTNNSVTIQWQAVENADSYNVYWQDSCHTQARFKKIAQTKQTSFTLNKSTLVPHYFCIGAVVNGAEQIQSGVFQTPITHGLQPQLEKLGRGLVAVAAAQGVFLSWRLFKSEVDGFCEEAGGMTGVNFDVYKNGKIIAAVDSSTNYIDKSGTKNDEYAVAPAGGQPCEGIKPWQNEYFDVALNKPAGGVTLSGEKYEYSANDISVADVDGDGEYEIILKWDPSNAHDVSHKGYTGNCLIDCYKMNGRQLWRIDMGCNIRAGAHYTQPMVFDFNGDGKAEISIKTAPGTSITRYDEKGSAVTEYITLLPQDIKKGVTHGDDYRCNSESYFKHIVDTFLGWHKHPQVVNGTWCKTLEECFGIPVKYSYPLSQADAKALADYFIDVFAPSKSERNKLRDIEGFIYEGPEYLTMLSGLGAELETIEFPFLRVDDGLMWGDYSWTRIEPCNRVDRFLSGVAYLDGIRPSLIVCRGYYTRAAVAAYNFDASHKLLWQADSGFVPMNNPFNDTLRAMDGTSKTHGSLSMQGNHSLSTADVDGDGFMEIIYGAATIDHDGSVLYSTHGEMPDGRTVKLGHGDAMHVGKIDPDRPGMQIFNVFEGCEHVPYGFALRDAESGEVFFGEGATTDLGRCMVGDVCPDVRGMQCWVNNVGMWDLSGNLLRKDTLGTNMSVRFAADLSTQITDGAEFMDGEEFWGMNGTGLINDYTHGVMLAPKDTSTNNGTKGNPCLVADLFGDFREEILLRTKDSTAVRIYTSASLTSHKLPTLMHDTQYRCGIAWQNNCYNQPCYPTYYYGSDMSFAQVIPALNRKTALYLAGDSTMAEYSAESRPQSGWGEWLEQALDNKIEFEVKNYAMGARSSKTFIAESRLAQIAENLKEGDWLLIQFGHNDASQNKPERFVPVKDFADYLMQFINTARQKGATPVLISPVPILSAQTDEVKQINTALPLYCKAMEQLAKEQSVAFVDMYSLAQKQLSENGDNSELYMPDFVHLTQKGAKLFAAQAAKVIKCLLTSDERRLY